MFAARGLIQDLRQKVPLQFLRSQTLALGFWKQHEKALYLFTNRDGHSAELDRSLEIAEYIPGPSFQVMLGVRASYVPMLCRAAVGRVVAALQRLRQARATHKEQVGTGELDMHTIALCDDFLSMSIAELKKAECLCPRFVLNGVGIAAGHLPDMLLALRVIIWRARRRAVHSVRYHVGHKEHGGRFDVGGCTVRPQWHVQQRRRRGGDSPE